MSREHLQPQNYFSYLLRVWQEDHDGQQVWRASLESAQGGQRVGFAALPDLFAFLVDQTKDDDTGKEVTSV